MSRGGGAAAAGLALVAAIGIALIALAPDWRAPLDADLDDPGSRRSYVTAIFEDVTTRNPWSRNGPNASVWNAYAAQNAHQFLFTYTTQRYDWVPELAADFPEPLTHDPALDLWRSRVRLKAGVLWSDGTPVTADDVAFTFEAIAAFGANELGGNFPSFAPSDLLARVEVVDDHTVEFFLKRRDARYNFGILLAPIFQRGFWTPHVARALESPDPLNAIFEVDVIDEPATGPFIYGTWERGSFVNRPANRRFSLRGARQRLYENGAVRLDREGLFEWTAYGEPPDADPVLEVVTGPHVDAVHYRVYGAQATGVLALQAGQVDYLFNPLGLERGFHDQLRETPGVEIVQNPTNGIRYLAFNLRREPMSRLAFRQAAAVLIDREFVTERVLQGVADPLYSVVPPGNAAWYNPDVPVYGAGLSRGARIQEAVRLLEADGFTWAQKPVVDASGTLVRPGRGLRLPNGSPVPELELLGPGEAYDPLRATFAAWIERWLNEAGIPVRPVLTAFNTVSDRVFDRQDFDMYILGWSLTIYPSYLESFFHSRYGGLRGHNAAGYNNPEYDRLLDEFLQEADDMDRARTLAHRLQDFLARDLPYIVLFDTPIVEAYRAGHVRFPTTDALGGIQNTTSGGPVGFTHAVQLVR